MPTLDLTADDLGRSRSKMTLAYLEGVMLWPDNETRRARAMWSARASYSVENDELPTASGGAPSAAAIDVRSVLRMLREAPPSAEIQADAAQPYRRGCIAGRILGDVLAHNYAGGQQGVQEVKAQVRADPGVQAVERFSASTLENGIWRTYRPVAHLWLAYAILVLQHSAPFPCRLSDLELFLGLAETLRTAGASIRPWRAVITLLDDSSWSTPTDLTLPIVTVGWPKESSVAMSNRTDSAPNGD